MPVNVLDIIQQTQPDPNLVTAIQNGDVDHQIDLHPFIQPLLESDDSGHTELIFPPGRYRLDTGLVIKRRRRLRGLGGCFGIFPRSWRDSCELHYRGSGVAVTIGDREEKHPIYGYHISLSSMSISSATPGGVSLAEGGILIRGCDYVALSDIHVENFNRIPSETIDDGFGIKAMDTLHLRLDGVNSSRCGYGLLAANSDGEGSTVWEARACNFRAGKYGAVIRRLRGSAFYSCTFESNTRVGLKVESSEAHGLAFYSCWFENNPPNTTPIFDGSQISISVGGGARHIHFHNPYIQEVDSVEPPFTMLFDGAEDCTVWFPSKNSGPVDRRRIKIEKSSWVRVVYHA